VWSLNTVETSSTIQPTTQRHILQNLNPQQLENETCNYQFVLLF
jgi:hypothetical protein